MDRNLVATRLSQYAAAWLGAFLLVLLLSVVASLGLGMDLVAAADGLLLVAFAALSLLLIAGVALTFASTAGPGAKVAVLLLALVLGLPLLWAPVLAVVLAAGMAGVPIEYSGVYAQFRITVSQLLYPLVSAVFSGAALRFVWELFQVFATVVGAIASAIQVWKFFRKLIAPRLRRGMSPASD